MLEPITRSACLVLLVTCNMKVFSLTFGFESIALGFDPILGFGVRKVEILAVLVEIGTIVSLLHLQSLRNRLLLVFWFFSVILAYRAGLAVIGNGNIRCSCLGSFQPANPWLGDATELILWIIPIWFVLRAGTLLRKAL